MSFLSQLISELSVARRNAKPLSCNPPRCLNSVCLCAFVIKHARHTSYTNAYQVPNRAGLVSPFARSYLSFFVLFCFVCWCFFVCFGIFFYVKMDGEMWCGMRLSDVFPSDSKLGLLFFGISMVWLLKRPCLLPLSFPSSPLRYFAPPHAR